MDQYKGSDVDKYRSFMSGEGEKNTTWKYGAPPNFDVVNKLFEEGRTKIWPTGSLEEQVQNLVKTWEMEMFHKVNPQDIKAVDVTKLTYSVNGGKPLTSKDVVEIGGGYNMFLQTSIPEHLQLYNPNEETADSAKEIFTTTFPRGFALEVLEVYSGPPVIAYKFRHWAYMEGPFKGYQPTNEIVEMFGVSIVKLDEQFKIVKIEFFYDKGELLAGLIKGGRVAATGDSAINDLPSSKCPFS
ncbi:putative NTF2-like domain superfamily protein [Helianthus annuus]|uniref:NTF2-like domain superfamily protein n=1 Tax=Helianthus annuus TaxID=4232 RepID=A0A251UZW7_HELAN|nr:pathogen-related protein [Helianthus annuus]KAF5809491.1 putative NTF2-like domain superfamily protein [Helianthus annuus]KAJ0580483.1 putative NTF2-like domain superfamily protein [Helianthus annuus]KAJ0588063.1 putative NTF2-like domain superfamily protein [Helianthus annuus]KAJ0596441.1 putative NTF2-like domain superfamily protein [Helianthus annuus]KAJ0757101.1 putative NTF2-like domain superfamily protein [Helianthus annuus]